MTQTVWIIRHGQRQDFIDKDWSASAPDPYDPPLSEMGRRQAEDVARRLADETIAHIFSSPFGRTLETATPLADLLDMNIKVDHGASENLRPQWYTHDPRVWSLADLAARFPRVDVNYQSLGEARYPEDWEQCKARAARAIRRIVAAYDGNLVFFGHGASTSSLAWGLCEGYPQFTGRTCSLIKLTRDGGRWRVDLRGDTAHLRDQEAEVRFA